MVSNHLLFINILAMISRDEKSTRPSDKDAMGVYGFDGLLIFKGVMGAGVVGAVFRDMEFKCI